MSVSNSLKQFFQQRLVQQCTQILFWQVSSKLVAFFANAWVARCLGPEKLGTSGMVLVTINQLLLAQHLINDAWIVRKFKSLQSTEEKYELVLRITSFRFLLSLALTLVGLVIALSLRLGSNWWMAISAGIPFLIINAMQPFWILQAQDDIAKNSRAQAIGSFANGILFFSFFRPGMQAGSDVIVYCVAMFISCYLAWEATKNFKVKAGDIIRCCSSFLLWKNIIPAIKGSWWIALSSWINYLYGFLDMPFVGWFCGLEEAGRYRTALGLSLTASQFFALLPYILYPRYIEWHKRDPHLLWKRQMQLVMLIFIFSAFFCTLTWLISPLLYHYLFGPEFQSAAKAFSLLMIAKCILLMGSICWWGLLASGQDKTTLAIFSVTAAASLSLSLWLIPLYGMYAAASISIVSESMIFIGSIIYAYLTLKKEPLNT